MCRGIHSDCSLYFTEGILKNPVKSNYQYEYAKRLRNKNIWLYHDKHRIVKHNITVLTETLRKSLVLRSETQTVLSDRGMIVPSRLWRIGRTNDAKLFQQELKGEISDFVVDVLIDASGSQMKRQGDVALQAYIISEALKMCIRDRLQRFWANYFNIEKGIYEQLLSNPDEVVSGTVKELAEKYGQDVLTMVGFLDGINDSLKIPNPIETMDENTKVTLAFDKELLYKNMVDAKADWLYQLPQWDEIFSEEKRKELYKEQKKSRCV